MHSNVNVKFAEVTLFRLNSVVNLKGRTATYTYLLIYYRLALFSFICFFQLWFLCLIST